MSYAQNSKFEPLSSYLQLKKPQRITLTFCEVEDILGFCLCPSARKHGAYWHLSKTHMLPQAWDSVGYVLESLDMSKQMITLIRK